MMQSEKFYRMLGLAARAGKLALGEGAALDNIRKGNAHLIIVSEDASKNTKKRFQNSGEYYNVPQLFVDDRFVLGHSVGKSFAVVMAVCDKNFADVLKMHSEE